MVKFAFSPRVNMHEELVDERVQGAISTEVLVDSELRPSHCVNGAVTQSMANTEAKITKI